MLSCQKGSDYISLQLWLPLIGGSIENQGLSDIKMNCDTLPTISTNGKLGDCFTFGGSTTNCIYDESKSFDYTDNFSVALWIKPNYSETGTQYAFTNGRVGYGGFGYGIRIYQSYVSCRFGDVNIGAYFTTDEWHHIVMTVSDAELVVYLDGQECGRSDITTIPTYTDSRGLCIGCYGYDSGLLYPSYSSIQDFRIYDHVLSTTEIQLISQGLVLHMTLGNVDGKIGGRNLLMNSDEIVVRVPESDDFVSRNYDAVIILSSTISDDPKSFLLATKDVPLLLSYDVNVPEIYANSSLPLNRVGMYLTFVITEISSGARRTWYAHHTAGGTPTEKHSYISRNSLLGHSSTILSRIGHYSCYVYFRDYIENYYPDFYDSPELYSVTTNNGHCEIRGFTKGGTISNVKLELGTEETPVTPAPEKSPELYDNAIYDCSGLANNGSVIDAKSPAWSSDSPRYVGSYEFKGSQYIACGRNAMLKDSITINLWAYMDDWSTYTKMTSCTEAGGWNFGKYGSYMQFYVGTGTTSNAYIRAVSENRLTTLGTGWHMFTGTYDGYSAKIYTDGELVGQSSAFSERTPMFYHSSNGIFIGAEASGNQTTPYNEYFTGKISDFRIYATALSDDDILQLYRSSAISNGNNILSYSFEEV